uniref:ATP-dependent RNA helicase n=1 Tax=Tetradesmus obliquus TaxID=3088 RepID=A0A383W307_TETOB
MCEGSSQARQAGHQGFAGPPRQQQHGGAGPSGPSDGASKPSSSNRNRRGRGGGQGRGSGSAGANGAAAGAGARPAGASHNTAHGAGYQQQQQQQQQQPRRQQQGPPGVLQQVLPHPRELHTQHGSAHAHGHQQQQQQQARPAVQSALQASALSGVMFKSLGLHPLTLSGLHDVFGYEEMFQVQASACPPALQGYDVLAKAKTGTGKTLAFLIPVAEHLAAGPPQPAGGAIRSLVLAPTRELAAQIKAEAVKLLQPHGSNIGVQMVIGGTNINRERSGLSSSRCDLLIATPGRLQDHLDSTQGFVGRLWGVQVLVMDEADRLLDMGFRPAIEAILRHLPPPGQRQALMFSATLPQGVNEVASLMMRGDYVSVNTVLDNERPSHESIIQEYMLVPPELLMAQLMGVIRAHMAAEPDAFKVIVFFPTARAAQFHAALARASGCPCYDLHSRLSQKQRDTAAAAFGNNPTGVIFASDVIARGLDFPDVSLVVQVGLTDVTQYEHRVGRTGRAGKTGEALLLLANDESRLLPLLAAMPLKPAGPDSPTAAGAMLAAGGGLNGRFAWQGLAAGMAKVPQEDALLKSAEQAFVATLGFLAGKLKQLGWSKEQLVVQTKLRFAGLGLNRAPAIEARTLGKMNLKGVPGIEIAPPQQRAPRGGGGGGGGGRGNAQAAAAGGGGGGGGRGGGGGGRGRGRASTSLLSTATSKQLLSCLSHFLRSAFVRYDAQAQPIHLTAADALSLAQQLTSAGLCPVLADAAGEAAQQLQLQEQLPVSVMTDAQQYEFSGTADAMLSGVSILQLALAVAAVWPGGILKSNTARCLAEPTVRLAVTVLQRLGIHAGTCGMRPAILHDIADTSTQLLLAAGRLLDSSSSSSSSGASSSSSSSSSSSAVPQLEAAGLQDSPDLLALTLLVLHGQLATAGSYLPAAAEGVQEDQEQAAERLTSQQQFEYLLQRELQRYRSQLHTFFCAWESPGRLFAGYWEAAPCWQQHSTTADIRLVLQVLTPLLAAWESSNELGRDKQQPTWLVEERASVTDTVALLWHLPVVLLQMALQAWQQQEVPLCLAAVRAAAAATRCLSQVQQWAGQSYLCTARALLLQWLQLVQLVLPEHSSSMGAAAATAPTAAAEAAAAASSTAAACSDPQMTPLLLELLAAALELEFDWSDTWLGLNNTAVSGLSIAAQLAAAMERIVRRQVPLTPEAAAAAAAQMAAATAAADAAAEAAGGEFTAASTAALCALIDAQAEPHSALQAADLSALTDCLWQSCVHASAGLDQAPTDYIAADSTLAEHLINTAAAIGATGVAGCFVEAAEGARGSRRNMAVPLQQQLHSMLSSAAKLVAGDNKRADWAEHDIEYVLKPLMCTAQRFVVSCQQQRSAAAGAVRLDPLAAAWLLLLAKGVRIRCKQLLTAVAVYQIESRVASRIEELQSVHAAGEASRSRSSAVDPVKHARAMHAAAAWAALSTAQLLTCLQLLTPAAVPDQDGQQQVQPASSSSSSSSAEGRQLESLAAAATGLQQLMTHDVTLLLDSCQSLEALACRSSGTPISAALTAKLIAHSEYSDAQLTAMGEVLLHLPGRLLAAADALCAALPVSCCCNNPDCANLGGPSEQQLVAGRGCVCARCKTARYCCKACQVAHWQQHRPVCKQLKAARTAAAAAAAAAGSGGAAAAVSGEAAAAAAAAPN